MHQRSVCHVLNYQYHNTIGKTPKGFLFGDHCCYENESSSWGHSGHPDHHWTRETCNWHASGGAVWTSGHFLSPIVESFNAGKIPRAPLISSTLRHPGYSTRPEDIRPFPLNYYFSPGFRSLRRSSLCLPISLRTHQFFCLRPHSDALSPSFAVHPGQGNNVNHFALLCFQFCCPGLFYGLNSLKPTSTF